MSLSSLLFPAKGKAKAIDKGLDDLFRTNAAVAPPRPVAPAASAPAATAIPTTPSDKKRKAVEETPSGKTKKSKSDSAGGTWQYDAQYLERLTDLCFSHPIIV